MKSLSGPASVAAANELGEDPLIVVKIEWATGTLWYADRDILLHAAKGCILNAGALSAAVKEGQVGSVGEMNFTMDDDDESFKGLLDTNCAEGTACTVYQSFASAAGDDDLVLLLRGVILQPEWHEGERTFTFGIETRIHDLEVGFAIEQTLFDDLTVTTPLLTDEAISKMFPLCFGSNVHVPAMKLFAPPETALNSTYKKGDTSFLVEDASRFPNDEEIDVIIDGMIFRVTVDKVHNKMNVADPNVPKFENVPFDSRVVGDPDEFNPWVAWIGQDVSLVNTFIYFETEFGNTVYHRVLRQEGRKIWLDNRVVQKKPGDTTFNTSFGVVPQFLAPPTMIKQVAKYGRDGWGIEMSYVGGATTSNGRLSIGSFRDTAQIITGVSWRFAAGEGVRMWAHPAGSTLHPVKFIVNSIESPTVRAVFAWRNMPGTNQRLFKAVPSSYYVVANEVLFGQHCTTVTLKAPLQDYFGQGWGDEIYVSHKSSVGPNASNVIKWLLENYSNLSVDAPSFAACATALANYPVAIVLTSKSNVLSLCEDIAWKSRCALLIEDGIAKLKYLSIEPSVDMSIDEVVVEDHSVEMTNSQIEQITTHFRASWKKDHSGRPHKSFTIVKVENVSRFGLKKQEFDFNIYNVQSLVEKSARFWAHRMANAWRYFKLNVLTRQALALEMLDAVEVDLAIVGPSVKCVLDAHSTEAQDDARTTFGLSLMSPWLAGTRVQDPNFWLSDAGDVLPADPVDQLNETTVDEQLPDDLSKNFVDHRVQSRLAKIINVSEDLLGFNVDLYDDGYEKANGEPLEPTNRNLDGTRQPFVAYPVDLNAAVDAGFEPGGLAPPDIEKYRNILPDGTRIQIFRGLTGRWSFNVPSDRSHVAAKVNGPPMDVLGRIGVTIYPNGFGAAPSETEVKAIHLGDVDAAVVGDKGLLLQHGDIKVFVPLVTSPVKVFRLFKITAGTANPFTGDEYNSPGGSQVLDDDDVPISASLWEYNGGVPEVGQYVLAYEHDDGLLWFNFPVIVCS